MTNILSSLILYKAVCVSVCVSVEINLLTLPKERLLFHRVESIKLLSSRMKMKYILRQSAFEIVSYRCIKDIILLQLYHNMHRKILCILSRSISLGIKVYLDSH